MKAELKIIELLTNHGVPIWWQWTYFLGNTIETWPTEIDKLREVMRVGL
jgi:hypothetical protein